MNSRVPAQRDLPRTGLTRRLLVALAAAVVLIPALAESAVVLMYHRFGEDRYPSTSIRTDQFEAHLRHLADRNYRVIPLSELLAALRQNRELPARAVAITIDDAYRSVYEVALPRLAAYGFPFTVFVATDPVDDGLPDYMSWEQLREMSVYGASFGNHGASHDSLIRRRGKETRAEWRERVQGDVEKGRRRLEQELDPLPGVFAYPYGEYSLPLAELLQDMSYVSFAQHSGAIGPRSDRRALPRFAMAEHYGDPAQFETKVASLPMPVTGLQPWDPVVTTRRPRVEVTLGATLADADRLACFIGGQGRVSVDWLEPGRRFRVGPGEAFASGRQRLNCTAPGGGGRFLWWGHLWIVEPR